MTRRKLGWVAGLVCLILAVAPAVQAQGTPAPANGQEVQSIRLKVGEQHVLSAVGVESFSEGVRGVVDVRLTPDAKEFVVVALNPGRTSLLLLMQNGAKRQFAIEVAGDRDSQGAMPVGGVKPRDNIRLDFYFVQLDRSYNHQIGMSWPGTLGNGQLAANFNLVSGRFETAGAVITQALPKLDLAQARGWAKLMRHAAVITANGEKASFSGGGEVNIPVQGTLSSNIHPIRFGSTLEIQPRYEAEAARLDLRVHAAVSDLMDDRGTGAPGRTTSELDTLVNLKLGESLILAGLNARSVAHNRSGIPGLSQIPLLGLLFGSDRSMQQHTENIVVIVPSVVDAVSDDAHRRVQDALRRFEAYSGDQQEGKLLGAQREPKGGRHDHGR